MEKFEKMAKVAKVDENGNINPNCGTNKDDESNYLTFRLWEKNGYKRIYANDYKKRSVGYINCNNGNEIVSDYSKGENFETMKYFVNNYEF